MANKNLFDRLFNKEVNTFQIFLTSKAKRTAITIDEYIQTRLLQGTEPDVLEQELLFDLENNGRIFSEFRRSLAATARGSINRIRDDAYYADFGLDTKYRWSAVLVKTCSVPGTLKGCVERHGLSKTWDEWEQIGLPRTGGTVCRENCHCVLIPDDYAHLEPIQRKART